MSTPGGEQIGEAHVEIDMDIGPALLALREFSREADRKLKDTSKSASPLSGILGKVGLGIGGLGAAAGTSLPLLASVVTALESIAPAGAAAATGLLAIQQATAVVKLGMAGVQDAVTAAFDTSAKGPEKFQKALDKLAPSAREFALTVRDLRPAFTDFQQGIQQELFTGFSDELTTLSTSVLPVLRTNLTATAQTLNAMALSTAQAAAALATDGTLGTAMAGANQGLTNLSGIPAQVTTALGQLAAAGAPLFDRLTAAAAGTATKISEKLGDAFKSGALEKAVNTAGNVLAGLGDIAGNVFGILGNVLGAASKGGDGLFAVLTSITQALQDATATVGFQAAIGALVKTMGVLADTVGPLLGLALAALGPVLVELAGPAQILIASLGEALGPIIKALGPVLVSVAGAVGSLVTSLAPLLPVIGNLIASLLPPLIPLFDAVAQLFTDMAPVIAQVGEILAAVLAPIIASLPQILAPFIQLIQDVSTAVLPLASQLLTALTPALISVGGSVAELAVALAPLITLVAGLAARILTTLTPVITPLIQVVGRLASTLATILAGAITNVVVPAIHIITSLFRGDFSGAGRAVVAVVTGIGRQFTTTFNAVKRLVGDAISKVVSILRGLGGRAKAALSNAGTVLYSIGRDMMRGLINGVKSMAGAVASAAKSAVSGAVNSAKDFLGISSPSKVFAEIGRFIGQGLVKGLTGTIPQIKAAATKLARLLRDAFESKGISRRENSLLKRVAADSKQLQRLASDRDKVAARLKSANDKLTAIEAKYAQVRSSIADRILSSGEIIAQGNAPVTATGILDSLKASVKAAQDFQKQLAKLKARGLRADLLEQIASAGVEAGSATAAALVSATPKQLAAINKAQKQLAASAKKSGTTVADALYRAGIKAAQGLVDGLASQQDAIRKQMEKIARAMIRAIRRELKIKSPSRAMEELGTLTGDGLVRGLKQSLAPVRSATNQLGAAVGSLRTAGPGLPVLSASAAGATALSNRSNSLVNVSAPKVTVMIGNRVIDEHVRVIVDRENAASARQQVQGVRR